MKRTVSVLDIVEVVVVAVTVLTGWAMSVWQLGRVGWIAGGGTAWLFTFSVIATLGAGVVFVAHRNGWHTLAVAGLIIVATSPTFYLIEILGPMLLVLVVLEIRTAIKHRRQQTVVVFPSSSGAN
jgi:hypothetical protein